MAKDATHTGPALLAHDMGGKKIQSLGTSTESDGAARVDQLNYVKARNADATTVGGLMEKTIDSETVTREQITDGGIEKVRFNVVPASPDSDGSWLYTARVPDSKLRDPVRCLLRSNFRPLLLQPVKCLVADQGTWSQVINPVATELEHSTVGEIFGLDSTHRNTILLEVGDRVWFRGEYNQQPLEWSGIYIVTAKGSATEQAVLTKAPFYNFVIGSCFEVTEEGAYQEGLWTCYMFYEIGGNPAFRLSDPLPAAVDGCGFGTWWQQIAGTNLWQAPVAGPIYGQDQFTDPSILLVTTNRVLAYDSDHIVDEGQYYGPYEVLDPGYYFTPGGPVLTRAIIRRVLDADSAAELCNGMTVRVTPGDVAYSGNYFTISTADPIEVDTTVLAWSIAGSYTDGGADRLLTTSQLGLASAVTAEVATEIPAEQFMEMLVALKPVTLDGTPGVSEFPAGPVTYEIACRVSSDDPAAEVLLSVALSPSNVGSVWIGEATSQPIRATSTTVYRLRAQVPAAVPLSPSDVLYWWFWVTNSGSSPVTLTVVYNDTAHSTRVQTTLTMASFGTLDHQLLTPESRGFPNTDQGRADAVTFRHPRSEIQDVQLPPTSTTDGNVVPAAGSDIVLLSSNITVNRIDTSLYPSGTKRLTLFFVLGGKIDQDITSSGTLARVNLGNFGGLPGDKARFLELGNNAVVDLLLLGSVWQLRGYNAGTVTVPE